MGTKSQSVLLTSTLAILLVFGAIPARAQVSPVDVRGVYQVSGINSLYDCTDDSIVYSEPFATILNIHGQEGLTFYATLGQEQGGTAGFASVTATLNEGLTFTGTWTWSDPQTQSLFSNQVATGKFGTDDSVELELTGSYGFAEVFLCQYRIAVSSEASILTWQPPDANAPEQFAPPRELTITPFTFGGGAKAAVFKPVANPTAAEMLSRVARPRDGTPSGYNVYRANTPSVETKPENLFTSVPSSQTSVPAPNGTSGSFFVVTATYPDGESQPSNEVSGGLDAATISGVAVKKKLTVRGSDFSQQVSVFLDGIPFTKPAKLKNSGTVVQKGALITGQTLNQYVTSGRAVTVTVRNENGGIATYVYTKP